MSTHSPGIRQRPFLKRVIVTPAVYPHLVEFPHFDIQSTEPKTALTSIAGTIHDWILASLTKPQRASPGRIHLLQVPAQQSQSFSQSYGSILPTFFTYIVLLRRGCSPRKPVMSTNVPENQSFPQIFKGLQENTQHHEKCSALLTIKPYLLAIRFHGVRFLTRKENSCQGSC